MSIVERLAALRHLMQQHHIDYYLIPSSDAHQNEYVPDAWQRRAWFSDFTGSAGDVLIGLKDAYLWTDGRYFLQAEQQLDMSHFTLMRQQQGLAAPIDQWLGEQKLALRVGVDPTVLTMRQAQRMQVALSANGGDLISIEENLVDAMQSDLPVLPRHPIAVLDSKQMGASAQEKIARLRQSLKGQGDAWVETALDNIAWLFNIRGQDIDYIPLTIAYALVTQGQAVLFIKLDKIDATQQQQLAEQGITVKAYDDFALALQSLSGTVCLDAGVASWWVQQHVAQAELHVQLSPITSMKACKNPVEIAGMRQAHKQDAVAVIQFLSWLEREWQGQTEISAAAKLASYRKAQPGEQGPSFATISGYGEHGAIIHYFVTPETDIPLGNDNLYLVDSGGQYTCGTTDITRTVHLGEPTAEHKKYYTLVLKGHLAMRHLTFPHGVSGVHIDMSARQFLWQHHVDYGHGTGHGVGCYLCVHEGPQRISPGLINQPLQEHMIVSNEPGLYLSGKFGIRIENLCLIQKVAEQADSASQHGPFYQMEDLTLVPYARNLLDLDLLNAEEIGWIDVYHQRILDTVLDCLNSDAQTWLKAACAPLN